MNRISRFSLALLFLAIFLCAPLRAQDDIRRGAPKDVKLRPHFVLSLYNFNIQYVIGDNTVKNRIVRESFEPLLDLYLRHPDWGCDIGMQGMMLEFLDAYHPDVLAKLRKLVERKQVEIIAFDYSHRLALAYPRHDQEWSEKLTLAVFHRLKLPRAPVAFLHEGQFGWGVTDTLTEDRMRTAIVQASTMRRYHGEADLAPLYSARKGYVLPANETFKNTWFAVEWNYFGYGEAALAEPPSPTMPGFKLDRTKLSRHEQQLAALAAKPGARVARISEYVDYALTTHYTVPQMPPMPDTTWGGEDSGDFFMWMGWYASPTEQDFQLLSENYATRNELVMAETLIRYAFEQGYDASAEQSLLSDAWRALLRAQAAGATGWHPDGAEVKLSLELAKQARETANNIIRSVKIKIEMSAVNINTFDGTVTRAYATPEPSAPLIECPVYPVVDGAADNFTIACERTGLTEARMKVAVTPRRWGLSLTKITFPLLGDRLQFSPALMETASVDYSFADFTIGTHVLPLSNGLIGLGDGKNFLIVHNDASHVAAHAMPNQGAISLMLKNAPGQNFIFTFTIFSGTLEQAVERANRINTFPTGLR
jgi:hypothetical protein